MLSHECKNPYLIFSSRFLFHETWSLGLFPNISIPQNRLEVFLWISVTLNWVSYISLWTTLIWSSRGSPHVCFHLLRLNSFSMQLPWCNLKCVSPSQPSVCICNIFYSFPSVFNFVFITINDSIGVPLVVFFLVERLLLLNQWIWCPVFLSPS